jgi:hypothetical protein
LYDASSRLIFHGGITAGRGHEGINDGEQAVRELLLNGKSNISRTDAFGCPIQKTQKGIQS